MSVSLRFTPPAEVEADAQPSTVVTTRTARHHRGPAHRISAIASRTAGPAAIAKGASRPGSVVAATLATAATTTSRTRRATGGTVRRTTDLVGLTTVVTGVMRPHRRGG